MIIKTYFKKKLKNIKFTNVHILYFYILRKNYILNHYFSKLIYKKKLNQKVFIHQ